MELPDKIAGLDPRQVRQMFKNLLERDTEVEDVNDVTFPIIRRMTPDTIEAALQVPTAEAQSIQAGLVTEGWIEPDKFTPTRKGMALAQHSDRPKISHAEAEAILDQVLNWADHTNTVPEARVKVKKIHLYGSLERGADEVGDIDLFVGFTTLDLGMNLQPEDMEREDELIDTLTNISEYLSVSSDLDEMAMDDVSKRQIFPQPFGNTTIDR
jgi:predicted nucleotidyltransferase